MNDKTEEQLLAEILQWLTGKVNNQAIEIDSTTKLISSNLLDSLGFLELISFLEDKNQIELDPDLLVAKNFTTPADTTAMVMRVINDSNSIRCRYLL